MAFEEDTFTRNQMRKFRAMEAVRTAEATQQQIAASGAAGATGADPVDGDVGYRRLGAGTRAVPWWTLERARQFSVAGYRTNPMARAIIDTHVAFVVGDSGLTLNVASPEVAEVAEAFWNDPAVRLGARQGLMLRSNLLNGEGLYQMMVGGLSGVCRVCPTSPTLIDTVHLRGGNPWWPEKVTLRNPAAGGETVELTVAQVDDVTGLRSGQVMFWPWFQAVEDDVRGFPFLGPVLDWLDSYDRVLSNLIDRTALSRYVAWQVQLKGYTQPEIDEWVKERGGTHAPPSGSIEVTNENVEWKALDAQSGTYEDTNTAKAVLTNVAGGAGLSKHWLAEPEDANRATSQSMAEPVRRRISSVQNEWLSRVTEMVRFVVDQAVAAGRLPAEVTVRGAGDVDRAMKASDTVTVTGPQIAAADAKVNAEILHKLSLGLKELVGLGLITPEAAKVAARKAWEDYAGTPYRPELDAADTDTDKIADAITDADTPGVGALLSAA